MKQYEPPRRYHILFAFTYLRYGLLLCLVPLLQALLAWDLARFFTALQQDAAILIACAVLSVLLWRATSFSMQDGCIQTSQGIFLRHCRIVRQSSIAAVEIKRPLYCRILGAAKLTLYSEYNAKPDAITLFLPKQTAFAAADMLLPVRTDVSVFAPGGFERLTFVMLSANVLTSWLFISLSMQKISDILGTDLEQIAQKNWQLLLQLMEQILPAGLSLLASAVFVIISVTLLFSFFHTMGFRVCRNGGVIINRGGFLTKIERRIRVQAVTLCDVRVTPVARLLGHYPVYVTAGSFNGGDIPLMVYRKNCPESPAALLPGFTPPTGSLCDVKIKSPVQYLWKSGTGLALSMALCGAAVAVMPQALPVLAIPALLFLGTGLLQLEAVFKEGVRKNDNRTLSMVYARFFTRHEICIFTPNVAYTLLENPFSRNEGRCDFRVNLPAYRTVTARGMRRYTAFRIPFVL